MKRPMLIAWLSVVVLVAAGVGYVLRDGKQTATPTGISVELMPGSANDESASSDTAKAAETADPDAGSDAEAIKEIMAEIEKTAAGDEGVLESEYAAESESFIDSTVVIEQLGTSYDETSY